MRASVLALLLIPYFAGCSRPAESPAYELGCAGPESHALDFWIGDWDVKSLSGAPEGRNVVQPMVGGCAVEERWQGSEGDEGRSLFFLDRARRRWKQVWVTSRGEWKQKEQTDDAPPGSVRFEGTVPRPGGGLARDRTTLTPTAAGVTQVIERSTDDGASWRSWTGVYARRPTSPSCGGPHRQLDFWIGDWDVAIRSRARPDAPWTEQRGRNRVARVLDGCGVEESFEASGGQDKDWAGKSLSRWVEAEGRWRQTWIDDGGGFLAFQGGKVGDDVVLVGEPRTRDGVTTVMRMVFTAITTSSLHWRWEASKDGGASWEVKMTIDYRRRAR